MLITETRKTTKNYNAYYVSNLDKQAEKFVPP